MNFLNATGTGSNDVKKIYKRMQKAKVLRDKFIDKNGPFAGTPDFGMADITIDWNRNMKEMTEYVAALNAEPKSSGGTK